MTARVEHIWRHPIKSHGREALQSVTLSAGKTMPFDRTWAVAHEGARIDGSEWAPCANFSRGSKAPELMAIDCTLDEATEVVTLSHPKQQAITVHPQRDEAALISWVQRLMPEDRAKSARVLRVDGRGMTDTPYPSISIANVASHKAVEVQLGQKLQLERWRANIWLDGLEPWEEFEWIGKTLSIGGVEFTIEERITRCLATTANTETGVRDADTLGTLNTFGHQDFGIYGIVAKPGVINVYDGVQVQ